MNHKYFLVVFVVVLAVALTLSAGGVIAQEQGPQSPQSAIGTAFTYQGQLKNASGPVNSHCDFQFSLWDALSGGTQVGSTLDQSNVLVSDGLFTVQLDFGMTAFAGGARWLETAVRCPTGSGSYTTLSPRQPLTAAPYANIAQIANTAFLAEEANNADTLDGQHASAFQQHYQNLVVVAKSGGDFTTITAALNSITANSASNHFTIYVAPGVYSETVTMKPYVDIEGTGELTTKITYTGWVTDAFGTVIGADNAELRFLTVENTGGANYAVAIYNNHASPRITHVTAIGISGIVSSIGVDNEYASPAMTDVTASALDAGGNNFGVFNYNSSPTMTDVTVTSSGGEAAVNFGIFTRGGTPTLNNVTATASDADNNIGVYNWETSPTMTNVTAAASGSVSTNYGIKNDSGMPTLNNVIASASGGVSSYGIYNQDSSPIMNNVTASASAAGNANNGVYNTASSPMMVDVTVSASGGTYSYGVYNYTNSSPTMINGTITASGGTNNYGVQNQSASSPTMTNVAVIVSGVTGSSNYGVSNANTSSLKMTGVTVTASGGTFNYGVWNDSTSATIQNSIISTSGGTNDGLHCVASSGTYTIKIDGSQISGGSSTIYQTSQYTTRVGASQLAGGGVFGGTYVCVASYNGNYAALNGSCQ